MKVILIPDYEDVEWLLGICDEVQQLLDSAGYDVTVVGVFEDVEEEWSEEYNPPLRPMVTVYLPGDGPAT